MKLKMTVWLTDNGVKAGARGEELSEIHYYVTDSDMLNEGWYAVQEVEIAVDKLPPRTVLVQWALSRLNEQESELREKYQAALGHLEIQRQTLLALEAP